MTTKFIGLKDFRQNIASYTADAKDLNIRYIILRKNIPVLEVRAIDEKDITLEKLAVEWVSFNDLPQSDVALVKEGRKAYKNGRKDKFLTASEFFKE